MSRVRTKAATTPIEDRLDAGSRVAHMGNVNRSVLMADGADEIRRLRAISADLLEAAKALIAAQGPKHHTDAGWSERLDLIEVIARAERGGA